MSWIGEKTRQPERVGQHKRAHGYSVRLSFTRHRQQQQRVKPTGVARSSRREEEEHTRYRHGRGVLLLSVVARARRSFTYRRTHTTRDLPGRIRDWSFPETAPFHFCFFFPVPIFRARGPLFTYDCSFFFFLPFRFENTRVSLIFNGRARARACVFLFLCVWMRVFSNVRKLNDAD